MSLFNHNLYNSIAIKPNSIAFFHKYERTGANYSYNEKSRKNLEDNAHKGILSDKSSKKINTAIDWLIEIAQEKSFKTYKNLRKYRFKLNFITLTLPSCQFIELNLSLYSEILKRYGRRYFNIYNFNEKYYVARHSDNIIKNQCLNQFLVEAKKKWQVLNYIWKAEAQSNGNIHFHITCDKFIPHTELRDVWNRIIGKLGYIDNYRSEQIKWHSNGFKVRPELLKHWKLESQKKAYKRGVAIDWCSPNSTDVHSVKNVVNLGAYLKKYYCKNEDKRPIEGRLWGVSRNLGLMKSVVIESIMLKKWHMKEFIEKYFNKSKCMDYCRILFVGWKEIIGYFDGVAELLFNHYIDYYRLGLASASAGVDTQTPAKAPILEPLLSKELNPISSQARLFDL